MQAYDIIARFYDVEHDDFTEDVDFYRQLVRDGPVLEVGAGTGRLLQALGDSGLEIWGVEPSSAMASKVAGKLADLPNVHLVGGGLKDLTSHPKFDYAILSLNTLWHFTTMEEQLDVVSDIQGRLNPRGQLVVDSTNPLSMADRGGKGELRLRFCKETPEGQVAGYSATWDDPAHQLLDITLQYETTTGGRLEKFFADLELHYAYLPELELMLRLAGFQVSNVYGSYELDPYEAESPQLLVVASRRS